MSANHDMLCYLLAPTDGKAGSQLWQQEGNSTPNPLTLAPLTLPVQ